MKTLFIQIAIVLGLMFGLFALHTWQVNKEVNKAVAVQTLKYNKQIEELTSKSLKVECNIKDSVNKITGEKDAKIKDITLKYNAAVNSLRDYSTSATSDISSNSCNAESTERTIDKRIFERHAQVSLGIARDAEELKTQLIACYQQYDSIKDQLDVYRR